MKQKILPASLALILSAFGAANSFAAGATAAQAKQNSVQKKKKIGMAKAREIALARATGKIEESELEKENGRLVYSFDIRNDKGTITEVQVEAYTGEVVSVEEENAAKEAAEKKQEKQEKRKH